MSEMDHKQIEMDSNGDKPVAVVTGTSKGIGLASVLKLIELGYIVIGCARSSKTMEALQQTYKDCDFCAIDVSNASQVAKWSERVISKYGAPSLLICNAGIGADSDVIENLSIKDIDAVIDVNVKGVIYTIKYFMKSMKENQHIQSKIVAISSTSGRAGAAAMSPYCASKWAVEGFMASIAKEIPEHMTAFAYDPGSIATEIMYGLLPQLRGKLDQAIQSGAVGPTQWAQECIPHMIGLKREDVNGKPVDRPNLEQLLMKNWTIYQQIVAQEK